MTYFFRDIKFEHAAWFHVAENVISESTLKKVDDYMKTQQVKKATMYSPTGEVTDSNVRVANVFWLKDKSLGSVYQEITTITREINNQLWELNLEGWEPFQYTEYPVGGHCEWHMDSFARVDGTMLRKVSISVGLTDDYEGGEIQLKTSHEENAYKLKRGDIIVFPSFILHRVAPVTKGLRKVIVGWSQGVNFI